jgi:5-methylcytosine-specific restriction endonuclease McrA
MYKMAKNTNKRIPVKWVRDRAKSAYEKKDTCHICGTTKDLELHHTHSITLLLNMWAEKNNLDISTDEGIVAVRDQFIAEHHKEIYEDVYTLCNKHHVMLHGVYGKAPSIASAEKQKFWIEKQKAKCDGTPEIELPHRSLRPFAEFYTKGNYGMVQSFVMVCK